MNPQSSDFWMPVFTGMTAKRRRRNLVRSLYKILTDTARQRQRRVVAGRILFCPNCL